MYTCILVLSRSIGLVNSVVVIPAEGAAMQFKTILGMYTGQAPTKNPEKKQNHILLIQIYYMHSLLRK